MGLAFCHTGLRRTGRALGCCALLFGLLGSATVRAQVPSGWLDLTSVTPGSAGTGAFAGFFVGTSITVSGTINAGAAAFSFNPTGTGINNSTIDDSSPQYSYSSVYSPTAPLTDRVGWSSTGAALNTVSLVFNQVPAGLVFHVANLDVAQFNFSGSAGVSSLTLLKGNNGADGDGIDPTFGALSKTIQDANAASSDNTLPTSAPPTNGTPRSAYGSVGIANSSLLLTFTVPAGSGDVNGGSFTMSVPEPTSAVLLGFGALGMVGLARRRARA